MRLQPSHIFFSQDSINNVFDANSSHRYQPIGRTLDSICEGRCRIEEIPRISVKRHDSKWISSDNRRLWVFRHLERLGKCDTIEVNETSYIPPRKMTSYNGGVSIYVRGPPGGLWYTKSVQRPDEHSVVNLTRGTCDGESDNESDTDGCTETNEDGLDDNLDASDIEDNASVITDSEIITTTKFDENYAENDLNTTTNRDPYEHGSYEYGQTNCAYNDDSDNESKADTVDCAIDIPDYVDTGNPENKHNADSVSIHIPETAHRNEMHDSSNSNITSSRVQSELYEQFSVNEFANKESRTCGFCCLRGSLLAFMCAAALILILVHLLM